MPTYPEQTDAWAGVPWAVVTKTGILQARCGRPTTGKAPAACTAWRLSAPGGGAWRRCYACGSDRLPVPIAAAGAEALAEAIATASKERTRS